MSSFSSYRLKELFPTSIPGEWGSEPIGVGNALVLRAADFTKDCKLRSDIGAPRNIPIDKLSVRSLKNGDLLIEKSGGSPDQPVGRVALFDRESEHVTYSYSNFLQLLRTVDWINPRFAHYLMLFCYQQGLVFKYQQQTTGIINLKLEDYLKEKVTIPISPDVRDKISNVLYIIDQTIEKTEALIEKYQQIKAGLMHDLFTRGVSAEGKLRPTREQAPELYQETSIGWIPKEWDVSTLRDQLISNPTNGLYKPAEMIREEGTLMVGQTAFTKERSIDYTYCRRGIVSEAEIKYYGLSKGDILVTRVFATADGVGLPTLVPEVPEAAVYESNMMRLQVKKEAIIPRLLFEWLRWSRARKYILSRANASNQVSVNQAVLNVLPVPRIGMSEQSLINGIFLETDLKLKSEKDHLIKLCEVKQGLMQDLLTGKVEIKVEEPEAAHV